MGFYRGLRVLTLFWDFGTLIFEIFGRFYFLGEIFMKNGPFKLYLLWRSRFRLLELDKCFVVLDLTRVWSIVFIWESFYYSCFCAFTGVVWEWFSVFIWIVDCVSAVDETSSCGIRFLCQDIQFPPTIIPVSVLVRGSFGNDFLYELQIAWVGRTWLRLVGFDFRARTYSYPLLIT